MLQVLLHLHAVGVLTCLTTFKNPKKVRPLKRTLQMLVRTLVGYRSQANAYLDLQIVLGDFFVVLLELFFFTIFLKSL